MKQKNFSPFLWFGLAVPAGPPPDLVGPIAEDLRLSLAEAEIRTKLIGGGMFPAFLGPQAFGAHIQQEYTRYSRVIDDARIKLD